MVNKSVKRIQLSCRLYVQLVIYLVLSVLYPDTHTHTYVYTRRGKGVGVGGE